MENNLFLYLLNPKRQIILICLFLISCGGKYEPADDLSTYKAQACAPTEKQNSFEEVIYEGLRGSGVLSYNDLKDSISSACMNCHMAPSKSGNFTFIDSYKGEVRTISGQTAFYPGYYEIAEKVLESINHPDPEKRMPPKERRDKNPESFLEIGKRVSRWIAVGKPQGNFTRSDSDVIDTKPKPRLRSSEMGECTPKAQTIGFDYGKDRFFAETSLLPENLSDTDLFSLDAYELAQKGTVAYVPNYPLWADNARKGRWVHFPMKWEGPLLKQQSAVYDTATNNFTVPNNTRFYKTFYRKIKMANGRVRYKRVETRIIVVRTPTEKSLVGSYKWDDTEQTATLVQTPYRDGTTFKDTVFPVVVDEGTLRNRDYAIPGQHRCHECHSGSLGRNFVLGFSPIQLNQRKFGEAARDTTPTNSELSQVQRFVDYGFIKNAPSVHDWPKLETSGSLSPSNEYELRAQGYFVGNCAHCHNPNGLAFNPENAITLNLTAGSIFGFNTKMRSTQIPTRLLTHPNGDLDQSHIWRKVNDSSLQLGLTSQMPMSTPGGPDCGVLKVVGQWIKSFESLESARTFEPSCKKENEFKWIDQDFTSVGAENYIPRRDDWADPVAGMSQKYRQLELTPTLADAITKKYAVGYWNNKESCNFPEVDLPKSEQRPWMLRGGEPKRPFGEVYFTTPGSWYYRTSCMKCHGPQADGNTSLARGILNWSGGKVRVANFIEGMFGKANENLKLFNSQGKNYAPNYLIWMAMEGTRVQFPPELSSFLGKHGGQMLNQMREKCINQIAAEKRSSPNFMDHEVFNKICFVDNRSADDPALQYNPETNKPLNPEAVDEWGDRAAANIGFAIFDFLKSASAGNWQYGNDQCDVAFKGDPKK